MKVLKRHAGCMVLLRDDVVEKRYLADELPPGVAEQYLKKELAGVRRLQSVKEKGILVPRVLSQTRSSWTQPFVESVSFYEFLWRHGADEQALALVKALGRYLAKLHGKGLVHGDLSYHNMRFTDDALFLHDPGWERPNHYAELAKVLLDFEPLHPLWALRIPSRVRGELRDALLEGYASRAGPIDRSRLKRELLHSLRKDRVFKRSSPGYRVKKWLVNLFSKRLERRIQHGELLGSSRP